MNTKDELQEVILQAIEIIANKAVEDSNKNKDITLWTCKITDDSNRKSGEYKVTDGNVTFYAYSEYTDYKVDDHVAVVIPKGDFNNTKYIVQKVAADGTQLPFASPLDNYIEVTDDLVSDFSMKSFTIKDTEQEIARLELNNNYSAKTTKGTALYDALIFKCDFQTNLSSFKGVKGNYGIKVTLDYLNELGYPLQETLTFDSSEFLGNVYNFLLPSTQKKAFSLTKSETLQRIVVHFYQKLTIPQVNPIIPLIELEDLHIYFGSDISKVENQTLELYSLNGLTYYGDKTSADNEKKIGLMWYNKNDDGFVGFSDGVYDVSYDEEAYLTTKGEKVAEDIEFKKENAPKSADGVAAAAKLTTIENDVNTILATIDKIISAASDMKVSMYNIFSKITIDSQKIGEKLEKIANKTKSDDSEYLANLHKEFETDAFDFIKAYRDALGTTAEVTKSFDFSELDRLDSILSIDSSFSCLLGEKVATVLKESYGGYYGVFDSYNVKIKKDRATIISLKEKIATAQKEFKTKFNNRNEDTNLYAPFEEEPYENRYCVYWYEYEQGYESTNEYDKQFAGSNWKKLTQHNDFWNPGIGKSVSEKPYNDVFKKGTFSYSIAPTAKDKKIMAVLFYNHNIYKSNPLAFTKIASDGTVIDDNGVFEIQHGDNSSSVYQSYGEDSYLLNSSDARRERILLPQFISTLGKSLKDFVGGQIYWYLPETISMLGYDENNEQIKTYAVSKDINSIDPSHYRQGYRCFTKSIQNSIKDGSEVPVTNRDLSFSYLINNYYSSTYTNNTIYCKIVNNGYEYEASMPFTFSCYGTSGTDYTLAFQVPSGGRSAITKDEPMILYVKLLDYNRKEVPLYLEAKGYDEETGRVDPTENTSNDSPVECYGYGVTVSWDASSSGITEEDNLKPLVEQEKNKKYIKITLSKGSKPIYGILRVNAFVSDKINKKQGLKLVNAYSVPYSNPIETNGKDFIEGVTQITYSSFGNDPKYYKDPYKLYNGANMSEQTNVKWTILSETQNDGFPKIDETNKVIARDSFTEDIRGTVPVAIACDKDDSNKIYWYQPILIQQNQYEFKLLNEWNGKMQINEKEGYILSNMLVAGKKANNLFTGVVMGDMGTLNKFETGLFGIHEGVSSFGFKTDGTAYLGKSGSGRIVFNGTKGTITSDGYNDGKGTGIFIDLDDPKFHIIKTVDGITKDLLSLDYKDPNNIFFLRSFDFEDTNSNKQGFELDIQNGKLKAYNGLSIVTSDFNLISTKDNFAIKISSDDFILKADEDYYISKNTNSAYGVTAGIKWGEYFHVNSTDFHLGNRELDETVTPARYKSSFIYGNSAGISFNFTNGTYLKFGSDGFTTMDGDKVTMNIVEGQQLLQGSNYSPPTYNEDGSLKTAGTGMLIDLHNNQIKAYSGLTIVTNDFDLGTIDGNTYIKLKPEQFEAQANKDNYIKMSKDGLSIKTSTFDLKTADDNYLKSGEGLRWGSATNYIKADSKGVDIVTDSFTAGSGNNILSLNKGTFSIKSTNFLFDTSSDNLTTDSNYGKYLSVTKTMFRLGSKDGTNISGSGDNITFNFKSGVFLKFSDNGLRTTNNGENVTMVIEQGVQKFQSSDYYDPNDPENEGKEPKPAQGMKIDLLDGKIKAYSGLTIVTDEFNLGTTNQSSGIVLTKQYFKAYADDNNYIIVQGQEDGKTAGIDLKAQNFDLVAGNNYLKSGEGLRWGNNDNYLIVNTNRIQINAKKTSNNGTSFMLNSSPSDDTIINVNERTKIKTDGTVEIYNGGFAICHESGTGNRTEYIEVEITSEDQFNKLKNELYIQDGESDETKEPRYVAVVDINLGYDPDEVYYQLITMKLPDPYLYIGSQDEVGGVRTVYLTRTHIKTRLTLQNGQFDLISNSNRGAQSNVISINSSSLFFTDGIKIKYNNQGKDASIRGDIYLGGIDQTNNTSLTESNAKYKKDYRGMIGARGLIPNSSENTIFLLSHPESKDSAPIIKIGDQTLTEYLVQPIAEHLNLNKELAGKKGDVSLKRTFKIQYDEQKQANGDNNYGDNQFISLSLSDGNNFYEAIEFHIVSPHDGESGIYFNCDSSHVPLRFLLEAYKNMTSAQNE